MKKVYFMLIVACMGVMSCTEKSGQNGSQTKVTEYGYGNLQLLEKDGKFGLAYKDEAITKIAYDSIWRPDSANLVLAKNDSSVAVVTGHSKLLEDRITEVTPVGKDQYIINADTCQYFVKTGDFSFSRAYQEVRYVEDFFFCQNNDSWGVFKIVDGIPKQLGLTEYKKIYILKGQQRDAIFVVTKDGNWELYNTSGVRKNAKFKESSNDVKKKLSKYNTNGNYGVIHVDFL